MKPFIVCSFFTRDTPYEEEIKVLIQSCNKFNVPIYTQGYSTRGSWVRNCAIKPEFLYEMMLKFRDSNIVFIDADGEIKQYPRLFETLTCDFAAHIRKGKELLSGTLFIQNTSKVRQFIKDWVSLQAERCSALDQVVLNDCLNHYKKDNRIIFENLPANYTQIFDTMRHHGSPVIEHHQASRRFKRISNLSVFKILPEEVKRLNPRVADDGTFYLARCTNAIERLLDKDFTKLPNENRWYPRTVSPLKLEELKPHFDGKRCYIIGKGPSLDLLTRADFPDETAPVICINESIHKIESLGLPNQLFILQQDTWIKDSCRPKFSTTIMILKATCKHWYADILNKYCFHHLDLNLNKRNNSVIYAIMLAKLCGATSLVLLAFDAAMNGQVDYAKVIGYKPETGGDPQRFLKHRAPILKYAQPLPITFTSAVLAEPSSGIPLPCTSNH